ncbi:MAG: MerR family transcriptional regulator [Agathobacter sp.]|nr:MerR family transcriptional regulator [Agathobacter sp.]
MTIKEIEELSGMPRANIRYYEEQGLLSPIRSENGYRDYSADDLQILQRIKLLRSIHMSMEEIKALHTGERELLVVLEQQMRKLPANRAELDKAQSVCETMYKDGIKYESLDAEKYLRNLNESTQHIVGKRYGETKESREDRLPRVQAPWRRFFARELDLAVYSTLWYCFMLFAFQMRTDSGGFGWGVVNLFVIPILVLVLEPLQLSLFGTTLGKWILGLRVVDNYDGKLSFSYAYDRTKDVLFYGMMFNIPFVRWFRLWKSFSKCLDGEELEWEYGSRIVLKDKKKYRVIGYIAVYALLTGLVVLADVLVEIPVHRGELTVVEFCKNYRRMEKVLEITSEYTLDDSGVWQDNPNEAGVAVFDPFSMGCPPEFIFETDEDGNIQKISFVVEVKYPEGTPKEHKQTIPSHKLQMMIAALAYVGAQEEFSHFSSARVDMMEQMAASEFKNFDFTEAGVRVTCDVESTGYEPVGNSGTLWSTDDAACSFYMEFGMSKQN